jgi:hypothetical protein
LYELVSSAAGLPRMNAGCRTITAPTTNAAATDAACTKKRPRDSRSGGGCTCGGSAPPAPSKDADSSSAMAHLRPRCAHARAFLCHKNRAVAFFIYKGNLGLQSILFQFASFLFSYKAGWCCE